MVHNQVLLLKFLEEIKEDTNKVLTNQWFTEGQWIHWNTDKKCFEYEDNTFLGYTSEEVIFTYEKLSLSSCGNWLKTASWYMKSKNREED